MRHSLLSFSSWSSVFRLYLIGIAFATLLAAIQVTANFVGISPTLGLPPLVALIAASVVALGAIATWFVYEQHRRESSALTRRSSLAYLIQTPESASHPEAGWVAITLYVSAETLKDSEGGATIGPTVTEDSAYVSPLDFRASPMGVRNEIYAIP